MADWPSSLPVTTVQGYGFEPVDPILRTEMESGPKRQRRQYSQTTALVSVRWLLDDQQLATFESFHRYQLNDGASWFNYPFLNGAGKTTCQARFSKSFKSTLIAVDPMVWDVSSELEIKNRPVANA